MSSVKLVSYSRSAIEGQENWSLLDQVAYAARVSNPANQMNTETAEKLVRYLLKNHHWSPLEMVSATVEITTTRALARQILRHRSFSFQEFSQRYAAVLDPFVQSEARLQDTKNRQNSIELTADQEKLNAEWQVAQRNLGEQAEWTYKWALDNGIAKEVARNVLPEGMTVSKLYMAGTMRSWVHYIDLRTKNGTQKEHMIVAQQCAAALEPIFPMITEFLGGSH
jgi:thymidylate synthase (FAD)